jgi:hypothetical protein
LLCRGQTERERKTGQRERGREEGGVASNGRGQQKRPVLLGNGSYGQLRILLLSSFLFFSLHCFLLCLFFCTFFPRFNFLPRCFSAFTRSLTL